LTVAAVRLETGTSLSFSVDLNRGLFSRVAEGLAHAVSSDGRIAFSVGRDIYVVHSSGVEPSAPLFQSSNQKHPNDWSPDGRFLIFDDHHPSRKEDLWVLPLFGS